jgi:predicted DNA-binding protein (UPF0251 family)
MDSQNSQKLSREDLLEAQNLNLRMQLLQMQREEAMRTFDVQQEALLAELTAWRMKVSKLHGVDPEEIRFDLNTGAIVPKG